MSRIAVIGSYAPSLLNFRGTLLQALVDLGHEVYAMAPEGHHAIGERLAAMGVHYCPIGLNRTGMNVARDVVTFIGLVGLLRRLNPDVVLSYTIKPIIHGSLASRLATVPTVASMVTGLGYAFSDESRKHRVMRALVEISYRWSLRFNQVVFFQNPDDLSLFRERKLISRQKCVLINGSGVDLDRFQRMPVKTNPMSFLLIGRMLKEKGIYEYLAAASTLRERYPAACFRLLGPVDSNPGAIPAPNLHQAAVAAGVEYIGAVDDVRPYLNQCSVYVLPSYYREGTPRSVLEAMAVGRPIITTNLPGCRETVRHGINGFLVAPRDARDLAITMERFILQPQLIEPMGDASRVFVEEKYDVHKVNFVILQTLGLQP